MGFFPTDAVNNDEVGPNSNGTYFKYVAVDDKWIVIPAPIDVYTEAEVDALIVDFATEAEAHAYVEANELTLTKDLNIIPATGTAAELIITSSEDAKIELKGDTDNDDEAKHAWMSFFQDGVARFLHIGVGKEDNDNEGFITVYEKLLINVGALGSATKYLEINATGIDVVGNITVSGTVDGVDILARDHDTADAHAFVEANALTLTQTLTTQSIDMNGYGVIDSAGLTFRDNANSAIVMEDHFTTDHRYHGIVLDIENGNLAFGLPAHVSANNTCIQADANVAANMPCIGVSVGDNKILTHGVIYDVTYAFTAGNPVYVTNTGILDDAVPTVSGEIVQVIGIAIDADTLLVNPSFDWVVVV